MRRYLLTVTNDTTATTLPRSLCWLLDQRLNKINHEKNMDNVRSVLLPVHSGGSGVMVSHNTCLPVPGGDRWR